MISQLHFAYIVLDNHQSSIPDESGQTQGNINHK